MDEIVPFLLIVVAVIFVLPIVAIVKASRAQRSVSELKRRLAELEQRFAGQRAEPLISSAQPITSAPKVPEPRSAAVPPPLPAEVIAAGAGKPSFAQTVSVEPRASSISGSGKPSLPAINWEQFMGAKLFAWLGGLALFLGIAFFVKYSFEHNLVSPELRVAMGFMVGLGLVAGGLWLPRSRQVVTAQTLCATGVLVLYADSLVSHTYYHFLGAGATFGLMALVTVAAFGLAIRLEAQVIAVLGLLGGFLTPPLLSTGVDHSGVLFAYLGLLDAGLVALALRLRWKYLVPLGAGAH